MDQNNEIAFFAKTNFRQQDRVFGIKVDDRRRHMYIIGKTGMGKTNLIENLAIQDIQHGHGIAYVDPHGDTAEKLIQAIPTNRINDVVYFNPSDQDFPIAFNIMEQVEPQYRPLVASGLIGVFKKLWADSWGPRLEYILRNAILALLEYPGSTLLGVNRLLVDKDYRKKVVDAVTDPVVRSFWVDEFTKWNDRVLQEVVSPIQNKVGQFLSNPLIRNVIGQTHTSFDIRDIMDSKKILIMNLSKGRIGEDMSALLGALMITKIQLAAMGRVDIEEEARNDFYLYVDEFQNFATESFANILSEARKYRLNLIVANQYITQLDEIVRDAIFGNAGTIISFRVGGADAEFLEKEFEPVFMMNDIVNLPKYQIYLKLMIDGIAGDAFSATTLPPIEIQATKQNAETIIRVSRERYANGREDVEDKIRRWSGMLSEEEKRAIYNLKTPASQSSASSFRSSPVSPPSARPMEPHREYPTPKPSERPRVTPDSKSFSAPGIPSVTAPSRAEAVSIPERRDSTTIVMTDEIPEVVPKEAPHSTSVEQETRTPTPTAEPVTKPIKEELSLSAPQTIPAMSEEVPVSERMIYEAQCSVCHEDIEVPFPPDGKRPTFCREHLKEYQRLMAKERQNVGQGQFQLGRPSYPRPDTPSASIPPTRPQMPPSSRAASASVGPKSFVSEEKPLTLYQMQHVAPKKFKRTKEGRPALELDAIRDIIQKSPHSE